MKAKEQHKNPRPSERGLKNYLKQLQSSLLITFFCKDHFLHSGHFIYLLLPICGAINTELYVGTYLWWQC